jgi:hypothetical protein
MTDKKTCGISAAFCFDASDLMCCGLDVLSDKTVSVSCVGDARENLDSARVRVDKLQPLSAVQCGHASCWFGSEDARRLLRELSKGQSVLVRVTLSNLPEWYFEKNISLKEYGSALGRLRERSREESSVDELEPQGR